MICFPCKPFAIHEIVLVLLLLLIVIPHFSNMILLTHFHPIHHLVRIDSEVRIRMHLEYWHQLSKSPIIETRVTYIADIFHYSLVMCKCENHVFNFGIQSINHHVWQLPSQTLQAYEVGERLEIFGLM
jgi:hypothetical protein